jgi:hypothetical protein
MRYIIPTCLGIVLVPIGAAILLYMAVMTYANPRVGMGEHFPIPTYNLHR